MNGLMGGRIARWLRVIGPIVIVYCVFGLIVEAGVPRLFPENAFTTSVSEAARAGVFAIWFYLIWRIGKTLQGLYGARSAQYLELTPIWRILVDVFAAFVLAAFCFSVLYVYVARLQGPAAFSAALGLGAARYLSLVTQPTTRYGDN